MIGQNMKNILFVLVFISALLFPQQKKEEVMIPIDSSFSLASTNKKILEAFPVARQIENTVPENVLIHNDVVYKSIGKRTLHIDLYIPKEKRTNHTAIILIHGGGWRSGNKSMEKYLAARLASKGFVALAVEYRLSMEALYPAALHDLKSALKWTIKNSRMYGIDKKKIILLGESAGGHLATLVGVTSKISSLDDPTSNKTILPKVTAIINIDGVMDMTTPSESKKDSVANKPASAAGLWLGATLKEKPELWKEVSPINYIDKDTPPILFINSALPRYHAGRDEAIKEMAKLGIYSEVHTIANTPHPFWYFHPWVDEAFGHIIKYIEKILKININNI
jgi:acetyl esterase/lipase